MLTRTGILSPRAAPGTLSDLAKRTPFISGQRVRHRVRRRAGRAIALLARVGRVVLVLVALAGVAAVLIHWLLTSPRFAVSSITVRGEARLSPTEVVSAAGIPSGGNLFRLDPQQVTARLLTLPSVKRAEVIRSFPNRLTLVVEERVPFALARAGHFFWLDEEGVSLGPEPRAVAPKLPLVSGLHPEDARPGGTPALRTQAALSLIRSLLRAGSSLTQEISEIDMSRHDGPVLYTVNGVEVRLGDADWNERLARLEGVLAQIALPGEPVEYVDLRFRDQVVFKPRSR